MTLRTRIDVRDVSTRSTREWAVVDDGETPASPFPWTLRREGKRIFVVDLNGQNLSWVAIPVDDREDSLSIVLDRDGACSLAHALLSIIEDDN